MPGVAPALPPGYGLLTFDEIGSTNAEAMRLGRAGETGPLWIWARMQTRGRGRSGRTWASPPGNLYASLLIRLDCSPDAVHQLSLLAGVATYEAVRSACSRSGGAVSGLRLKWPNDVLIDDAKLAGILPECTRVPGSSNAFLAVVGIGINLATHPEGLGRSVTDLAAHGCLVEPADMLSELAAAMHQWLTEWDNGAGFARVREAWLERAGRPGEHITINTGQEVVEGSFLGIDPSGALVLRDPSGAQRRFTYGDVTLGAAAGANEQ